MFFSTYSHSMLVLTAVRMPPLGLPLVLIASSSTTVKPGISAGRTWNVSCRRRMSLEGLSNPLIDLVLAENNPSTFHCRMCSSFLLFFVTTVFGFLFPLGDDLFFLLFSTIFRRWANSSGQRSRSSEREYRSLKKEIVVCLHSQSRACYRSDV